MTGLPWSVRALLYWDARSLTPAEARDKARFSQYVIGNLLYSALNIGAVVMVLATGISALMAGYYPVLTWLAVGHLPWWIPSLLKPRPSRPQNKPELRSLGPPGNWWFGGVMEEGLSLKLFLLRWEFFYCYEVVKQTDDHFVLRFWCRAREEAYTTNQNQLVTPLPGKAVNISRWKWIAGNVPIAITRMAFVVGLMRFGWRVDVLTSLYLSLFYILVGGWDFWLRWTWQTVRSIPTLPCLDVVFDSYEVTLAEANAHIERYVPLRDDRV